MKMKFSLAFCVSLVFIVLLCAFTQTTEVTSTHGGIFRTVAIEDTLTFSTTGTTTHGTVSVFPANSFPISADCRVTQAIAGINSYTVSSDDATPSIVFAQSETGFAAGDIFARGPNVQVTYPPFFATGMTLRVDTDLPATSGQIRCVGYSIVTTAPTS